MAKKTHAVGVIFEDLDGKILVLRRHIDDPEGGTWGLVGGKLDGGEDAISAAMREVEE
jgi:8-oxo-dGTP pyrophosphatase MutT (NUDIX family)